MQEAKTADHGRSLSTEDWIRIAKETLIRESIDAVKIDRLAKIANVTRGGFYWRFKSRDDLLNHLLADWRTTNTAPILKAVAGAGSPQKRYRALIQLWIDEDAFIPAYDTAVRSWAQSSPKVAAVVHTVDDIRMDAIRQLFLDAGYGEDEAMARARITYFHQIGYYALGLREPRLDRTKQVEIYYRILTGFADELPVQRRTARQRKLRAAH